MMLYRVLILSSKRWNFLRYRSETSNRNSWIHDSPVNWMEKFLWNPWEKWRIFLSLSLFPSSLPHFLRNASQLQSGGNIFSRVASDIGRRTRWKGRWKEEGKKKRKQEGGASIGGTQEAAFSQVARRNIRYG